MSSLLEHVEQLRDEALATRNDFDELIKTCSSDRINQLRYMRHKYDGEYIAYDKVLQAMRLGLCDSGESKA